MISIKLSSLDNDKIYKGTQEMDSYLEVGGQSLCDFFAAQQPFVCLKEAPKLTLCSLLTSDMLDIANNALVKPAVLSPAHQWLTQGNGDRHLKNKTG